MFLFLRPWPTPEPSTNWRDARCREKPGHHHRRSRSQHRDRGETRGAGGIGRRGCRGKPRVQLRELSRTHPLHAGFEPQEFLQEADVIFLLGVIAPWHPASKKLSPGTKVAVLSDNPLRSDLPYWGYPVNQILTGEIESSMKYLLESVKNEYRKATATRQRAGDLARPL